MFRIVVFHDRTRLTVFVTISDSVDVSASVAQQHNNGSESSMHVMKPIEGQGYYNSYVCADTAPLQPAAAVPNMQQQQQQSMQNGQSALSPHTLSPQHQHKRLKRSHVNSISSDVEEVESLHEDADVYNYERSPASMSSQSSNWRPDPPSMDHHGTPSLSNYGQL